MKKILQALYILVATTPLLLAQTPAGNDLVDLVNPLMGTQSKFSLSSGNTYPAIALPWGMNTWTPQTGDMGDGWAYTKIMAQKMQIQGCPAMLSKRGLVAGWFGESGRVGGPKTLRGNATAASQGANPTQSDQK